MSRNDYVTPKRCYTCNRNALTLWNCDWCRHKVCWSCCFDVSMAASAAGALTRCEDCVSDTI